MHCTMIPGMWHGEAWQFFAAAEIPSWSGKNGWMNWSCEYGDVELELLVFIPRTDELGNVSHANRLLLVANWLNTNPGWHSHSESVLVVVQLH